MQAIAAENNLAETAFFVREGAHYGLRWFTPTVEIDLCGHATLASAHLLFAKLAHDGRQVDFMTRSGKLTVTRQDDLLALELPVASARALRAAGGARQGAGQGAGHGASARETISASTSARPTCAR